MTATLVTLNATVAEIEDALVAGKTVKEVARDLAEPPNNVYGVYRELVRRGEIVDASVHVEGRPDLTVARQPLTTSQATGTGSASRPVPAPPTPAPPVAGSAEPTLDALVNAAARSTSKRTQALGVKLGELARVVRDRLREERDTAEAKAREAEVREKATAEVAELERKLAAARAKLKGSGRQVTDKQRANLTGGRVVGEYPCRVEGCARVLTTPAARGRHEKSCDGAA